MFVDSLKEYHISRPDEKVLITISKRYPQQLQSAIGVPAVCFDLYETVKELPSSFTRGVIEAQEHIRLNGPLSLAQPNILTGMDMNARNHILVKLLRIPQMMGAQDYSSRQSAVLAELHACQTISNNHIVGLVKCAIVEVKVVHAENLDVSPGVGVFTCRLWLKGLNSPSY